MIVKQIKIGIIQRSQFFIIMAAKRCDQGERKHWWCRFSKQQGTTWPPCFAHIVNVLQDGWTEEQGMRDSVLSRGGDGCSRAVMEVKAGVQQWPELAAFSGRGLGAVGDDLLPSHEKVTRTSWSLSSQNWQQSTNLSRIYVNSNGSTYHDTKQRTHIATSNNIVTHQQHAW